MYATILRFYQNVNSRLATALTSAYLLAFVPAIALVAYWIGGEPVLVFVTLCTPLLILFSRLIQSKPRIPSHAAENYVSRHAMQALVEKSLLRSQAANLSTGIYLIEIEGLGPRRSMCNQGAPFRDMAFSRMRKMCRQDDEIYRMSDTRFAIVLSPCLKLDFETMMQHANCLQGVLEEPMTCHGRTLEFRAAIGFCENSRIQSCTGAKLLDAAIWALDEAKSQDPSAMRSWSEEESGDKIARRTQLNTVKKALENGEIVPWYQPQICTSTGNVTGVEALARWVHPERGIVPPSEFLTSLEQAGLLDRLSETVFHHSLAALQEWDNAGIHVPRVSVNFSGSELRNPRLVDRLKWELDRFDMPASRLGVEILETVIADSPNGVTVQNISELAKLGCMIDLDDFGTHHASITTLRRFTVHRLKIDRSFVTRIDRDQDQRKMFAAVLGLADRLGLETLAEGVETAGEHALLAQLGCDHVQGFGIARPMASDQMFGWVKKHEEQVAAAVWQGRNLG